MAAICMPRDTLHRVADYTVTGTIVVIVWTVGVGGNKYLSDRAQMRSDVLLAISESLIGRGMVFFNV